MLIVGLVIFAAVHQQSLPSPRENILVETVSSLNTTGAKINIIPTNPVPILEPFTDNNEMAQSQTQNVNDVQSRVARWNILEFQNGLTITDCMQCDENVAVLLTCTRNSGTLSIQIPWLSFELANSGARAKVTLTIDDLAYVRVATLKKMALGSYVPEILLYTDDPLLERIAGGTELSFFMLANNLTTSNGPVALTGSRQAVTKIAEVCGQPNRNAQN